MYTVTSSNLHDCAGIILAVGSANKWWHYNVALSLISRAHTKKTNLRDLIAATSLVILPKLDSNRRFFSPCDLAIWWMTSKNNRAPLWYNVKLCASFQIHLWIQTRVTVWKWSICVKISNFFVPCDLEIWWMTSKNHRAIFLCYIKLCASFQSHRWFKTGVTVRKCSIRVIIGDFLSRVTLKFNGWPWKIIGHLFYVVLSFVHHIIDIRWFKIKLQFGNNPIWAEIIDFSACVTLTFDLCHDPLLGHSVCQWW